MARVSLGEATICFTDIEGSTGLLRTLGERYDAVLDQHYELLRAAFSDAGGTEIRSEGDSLLVVFDDAATALAAAAEGMRAVNAAHWGDGVQMRVRVGLHTGPTHMVDGDLRGLAVHQAARVLASAHGGQILCSETTASAADGSSHGLRVLELGSYRVRDFEQPVRLFQVSGEGPAPVFPAPRGTSSSGAAGGAPTLFVGREERVRAVIAATRDAPLVTVLGAGGVGKTRLAGEVAARLGPHHRDGVIRVMLGDVDTIDDFIPAVAAAAGVTRGGSQGDPTANLVEGLRSREALLLLDNCEHLVTACAALARAVSAGAPGVRVLATSRRALGVEGEAVIPLDGLAVPGLADSLRVIAGTPSVELFVDRAGRVSPAFELDSVSSRHVVRICHRVEGLPLAIELAASRARSMSVETIATRLERDLDLLTDSGDQGDPRRNIRAVIGWSHDMLTPGDQALFAQLSVFRGGCDLDAAQATCDPPAQGSLVDALDRLVEHSMLIFDGRRYRMLALLSEYAAEHLTAAGQAGAVRDRHMEHYAAIAAAAAPGLDGAEQGHWLGLFGAELDNLRHALARALEADHAPSHLGHAEIATALAAHLTAYLLRRQLVPEARRWIDAALPLAQVPARLSLLVARCRVAFGTGDYRLAADLAEEARAGAEASGNTAALGRALHQAAVAAFGLGDMARAAGLIEQAIAVAQEAGDDITVRASMVSGSNILRMQGGNQEGREMAAEARRLAREAGDTATEARATVNLGSLNQSTGNYTAAEQHYREALVLLERAGDENPAMLCLANLGDIARVRGDFDQAVELVQRALRKAEVAGDLAYAGAFTDKLGEIDLDRGNLSTAVDRYEQAISIARRSGDRLGVARRLVRLAVAQKRRGDENASLRAAEEAMALGTEVESAEVVRAASEELAELALTRRDLAAATEHLSAAMAASARPGGSGRGDPGVARARIHLRLARVSLAGDDPSAALALVRDALEASATDPTVVAEARALAAAAQLPERGHLRIDRPAWERLAGALSADAKPGTPTAPIQQVLQLCRDILGGWHPR